MHYSTFYIDKGERVRRHSGAGEDSGFISEAPATRNLRRHGLRRQGDFETHRPGRAVDGDAAKGLSRPLPLLRSPGTVYVALQGDKGGLASWLR